MITLSTILLADFFVFNIINTVLCIAGLAGACCGIYLYLWKLLQRRRKYPLHDAVRKENFEKIQQIIQEGQHNVNEQDPNNNNETSLHIAANLGNLEICGYLIDQGADVQIGNEFSETALHYAAENGYLEVCRLLLKHGAKADARESEQRTTLHQASEEGYIAVCRLLLEHGADSALTEEEHLTPYELAEKNKLDKQTLSELAKILYIPEKKKESNSS
ncbi:MAG: ankyrin repeat domain-containing protein [Planctomycetaceae bacterium]|jgi:ankyrin repeat protein|nr:ankyrin repeat domain-containing protein [Planctomycetaceae bacterium]